MDWTSRLLFLKAARPGDALTQPRQEILTSARTSALGRGDSARILKGEAHVGGCGTLQCSGVLIFVCASDRSFAVHAARRGLLVTGRLEIPSAYSAALVNRISSMPLHTGKHQGEEHLPCRNYRAVALHFASRPALGALKLCENHSYQCLPSGTGPAGVLPEVRSEHASPCL